MRHRKGDKWRPLACLSSMARRARLSQSRSNTGVLHYAASQKGQVEVVRMVIEHGADITAQVEDGTPLHLAAQKGQLKVASMLVEHGADMTA